MQKMSFVGWVYDALGPMYSLLFGLAGLLSFGVALWVVMRGRGPMAAAALVLVVPLPLLLSMLAMIQCLCTSFFVIATATGAPKPSELATGYAMSLVIPIAGFAVSLPAYLVAIVGAGIRSVSSKTGSDH